MNKTKLILDLSSLATAVAGGVLAFGDKWVQIPGLPDGLVHSWPLVIFTATVIDRVGNIIINYFKTPQS